MRPANSVLAIVLISLPIAACGSASNSTSSRATVTTRSTETSTTSATANSGQSGSVAAVATGPVRATLKGADHHPVVKRKWPYSVAASDAKGRPLAGSVDIQFLYGGQVVGHDTPPTHPLTDGRWHDNLRFPAAAIGVPLTFQVVVHTARGTVTLDWPVKVKR